MNASFYHQITEELTPLKVQLLAVSKTRNPEEVLQLYDLGQRDFGENYVQELLDKQPRLPADIRWHFIGHLQSNKVKFIAPFIYMIQGMDSLKLLLETDKQAKKNQRVISCLLQVHIAKEETKFGFDEKELEELPQQIHQYRQSGQLGQIQIAGLMGMASLTENQSQVRKEFASLKTGYDRLKQALPNDPVQTLSMGMSSDYRIAVEEGSTLVRIGTALFGARNYTKDKP